MYHSSFKQWRNFNGTDMRLIILIVLCCLANGAYAQKIDKIKFNIGFNGSFAVFSAFSIENKNGSKSIIDNHEVDVVLNYAPQRYTNMGLNTMLFASLKMPVLNKENWVFGIQPHVGLGAFKTLIWKEIDFTSVSTEVGVQCYFKHKNFLKESEILLGYKHTVFPIPYTIPVIGVRFNGGFEIYSSIVRDKYFMYLSNGETLPTLKIGELGMKLYL